MTPTALEHPFDYGGQAGFAATQSEHRNCGCGIP
jgi:hypothetical protein